MIRINLGKDGLGKEPKPKFLNVKLPPRLQARLDKLQTDVGMLIALVVALGISGSLPLIVSQVISTLEARHQEEMKILREKSANLSIQIEKLSGYQKELNSYEEQKKILSTRLASVRELLDARGTPVSILDSLAQSLPPHAWLLDVAVNLVDSGAINLNGLALSNEEISDYLDKLSRSIYINDVTLEDVSSTALSASPSDRMATQLILRLQDYPSLDDKYEIKGFAILAHAKLKGNVGSGSRALANDSGNVGVPAAAAPPASPPPSPAPAPNLISPIPFSPPASPAPASPPPSAKTSAFGVPKAFPSRARQARS